MAQSEVKYRSCYEKSRGVKDQSHSANFGPIAWKRIEPGNTILESMSYSFPSDRTKIGGVSLILDTAIASRQISKPGSTSAARNSALNTPILLCHTYSEPSGHKDSPEPPVPGVKMHPEMPGNQYFSSFGQLWVIQSPFRLKRV